MMHTIDSDEEIEIEIDSEDESKPTPKKGKKMEAFHIDFDTGDLPSKRAFKRAAREERVSDEIPNVKGDTIKTVPAVEQRLARKARKAQQQEEADEEDTEGESSDESQHDYMDEEEEQEFFDKVVDTTGGVEEAVMFSQLNLSRPFLRAIEAMGYTTPTPIQTQVIPYALAGRDICASAVTGSGKTAAFLLPILERLLYRPKIAVTRILVITPTRELAQQIWEVLMKLKGATDITGMMVTGGKKDVRVQEVTLRSHPDILICTPGRMLDHLRNTPSVTLQDLDVLVLDEVDRLLDLGFQAEVEELVSYCPKNRQTMLFSATMTPKVEDLVKLSLQRPVRVKVDGKATTLAPRLVQEFIKLRSAEDLEPILLSLLCRDFSTKVIVFFELKRLAHRFSAICNLVGLQAVELHGDLPQAQRNLALSKFKGNEVDVLVATDIAARGLDIHGVLTVINAEMPRNVSTYVHRVGRTARAGCTGRAITIVADDRRKIMKEILKSDVTAGGDILSRVIPATVLSHYAAKLTTVEGQLDEFFIAEKQRLQLESIERDAEKAENLLEYAAEIQARPQRTWFQNESQKDEIRERVRAKIAAEASRPKTATEQAIRLAATDDYRMEDDGKKLKHRLSRKKKRRAEALADDEDDGGEGEDGEEGGGRQRASLSAPKRAKQAMRAKEEAKKERSLSEMGMKKVLVSDDADGKRKRMKVVRQKFAVGGFDDDDMALPRDSGVRKKAAPEATAFKEFDATKSLRKGGKKSNASFKSKGKYKRRK